MAAVEYNAAELIMAHLPMGPRLVMMAKDPLALTPTTCLTTALCLLVALPVALFLKILMMKLNLDLLTVLLGIVAILLLKAMVVPVMVLLL